MGIILFIVALILGVILIPVFILFAIIKLMSFNDISDYFAKCAFSLDQFGNTLGGPMMNTCLLKKGATKLYGNPDETISYVTGVNYKSETLTMCGYFVAHCLDTVQKDHVENAANTDQHN